MAPWELAEQPLFWKEAAITAEQAEIYAENWHAKEAARKAKRGQHA